MKKKKMDFKITMPPELSHLEKLIDLTKEFELEIERYALEHSMILESDLERQIRLIKEEVNEKR